MIGDRAGSQSVSVVMPFFNASATLERALQSVAAQTKPVNEIIVVDDASAEHERESAQRIVSSYSSARLISIEHNAGPANARNIGWNESTGDWIAFLDCDDAWHSEKLERQLEIVDLALVRPALIAGRTIHVETPADLEALKLTGEVLTRRIRTRDLIVRNRMATSSVIVWRELSMRFPSERRFSEDYELWMTIAGRSAAPILLVDEPLAALFKAPFGDSGLSARIWPMILGEYRAYFGARRAGALSRGGVCLGLLTSTLRASVRLVRLTARRLRHKKL